MHFWGTLYENRLRTYVGVLLAFALALAASWIYWYGFVFNPVLLIATLIFAVLILLGDVFPIRVSGLSTVGVWDIALIAAIAALGPTWATVAAIPAAFFTGKRDWLRTVFEVGHSVTVIYLAGMVFSLASTPVLSGTVTSTTHIVYGTVAAGLMVFGANKIVMVTLLKVKYGQSAYATWKEDMEPYLFSDALNILTASLGILALIISGPVATIVVIGGSIGSQVLVYRSREQVQKNQELQERVRSLEESLTTSNMTFGTMMVRELGRRDGYSDRHAAATATYAADIAQEMKLDSGRVERLRIAGLLHNIGMFGLPGELLTETGKFNSVAKNQLTEHAAGGEEALAAVPEFKEMASWVRWHHERPDGRGYPDKLRGAWIPLEAKILAVAQAYAAMVLDQPRRPGLSTHEAREILTAGIDTEFDGVVVRAFLRIIDTESEGYRRADDYRFIFPDAKKPQEASSSAVLGAVPRLQEHQKAESS